MPLSEYHHKRSFAKTPEPSGKKAARRKNSSASPLHFVVQKHDASRLHYDFRLELSGALKSWAVPKGPSLNPEDKRLAMMVEDHPLDYADFEGTIPEGNYGAGEVIVWDRGVYLSSETADPAESVRKLKSSLSKGELKFVLLGEKLKGGFALVKLKNSKEENAWLLVKEKDRWAKETDITKKTASVLTGKKLSRDSKKSKKE